MEGNQLPPTTTHAGLSCKSDQWFTPPEIIDRVRAVLGEIDLDPCGSTESNKLVQAKRVITSNSLDTFWGDGQAVFCNPPSGKAISTNPAYQGLSNPVAFFKKLNVLMDGGYIRKYIYLGYSIEQIQYIQAKTEIPSDALICFPKRRIRFVDQAGNRNSPTHSNFILYRGSSRTRFDYEFYDLGVIMRSY